MLIQIFVSSISGKKTKNCWGCLKGVPKATWFCYSTKKKKEEMEEVIVSGFIIGCQFRYIWSGPDQNYFTKPL